MTVFVRCGFHNDLLASDQIIGFGGSHQLVSDLIVG